jgi:hypothetical protein
MLPTSLPLSLPLKVIKTPVDLLVAAGVDLLTAKRYGQRASKYFTSYPYYPLTDVFKVFKVADRIIINIFDMDDMPIINDHHFINLRGIYKLLIAFGDHTENAIASYRGQAALKTNIVKDRKKWPSLFRATSWPSLPIPSNDMSMTSVGRLVHTDMKLSETLIQQTMVRSWIQLQSGCTQSHLTSKTIGIARDSPNVRKKRDGKVVTIAKKYRPVYSDRWVSSTDLVDELAKIYPCLMINNIFPGSIPADVIMDITRDPADSPKNAYLVEYASGSMATILSITDPSDTIDVSRACPLGNFNDAAKALMNGRSFDEIVMLYGPSVV